jgi:beta-glucuronidase
MSPRYDVNRMRISVFVLLSLAAAASRAQQPDLIQNPAARHGASLDGTWQYLMDPYEAGYLDFHLNPIKDGGLGANRVPRDKGDKYELAFLPVTPTLQVPGDWNTQKPELLWYEARRWGSTKEASRPSSSK